MAIKSSTENIEGLLRPGLEASYDPQSLIALVPIHTDQNVADVGSGPGWLSIPLAKYLYGGKLHAIDPRPEMLDAIRRQTEKFRMANVDFMEAKLSALPLDDGSVDGAVLSDTLSEVGRSKGIVKECARILKKGGWLAVVEWAPTGTTLEFGPATKQRVAMDEVLAMGTDNGLTRIRSRDMGFSHYVVVFRK